MASRGEFLGRRVLGRGDKADLSRLLPYAAKETCPVGFVGRESLLNELDERKQRNAERSSRPRWQPAVGQDDDAQSLGLSTSRRMAATASLVQLLADEDIRDFVRDLKESLRQQIAARYCVLLPPRLIGRDEPNDQDFEIARSIHHWLNRLCHRRCRRWSG